MLSSVPATLCAAAIAYKNSCFRQFYSDNFLFCTATICFCKDKYGKLLFGDVMQPVPWTVNLCQLFRSYKNNKSFHTRVFFCRNSTPSNVTSLASSKIKVKCWLYSDRCNGRQKIWFHGSVLFPWTGYFWLKQEIITSESKQKWEIFRKLRQIRDIWFLPEI